MAMERESAGVGLPQVQGVPWRAASLSEGGIDWRALHEQYDGWDIGIMLRIVECESGGNAAAESPPDTDGLRNYGLHQHHGDPFAAGHPEYSTHQAYLKWQARGYQPWIGSQGCWG